MRLKKDPPRHHEHHLGRDLREGWRYVSGFSAHSLDTSLSRIDGHRESARLLRPDAPIIAGNVLRGGAHTLGFLMAASGIGALICAIGLVLRPSVVGLGRLMADRRSACSG